MTQNEKIADIAVETFERFALILPITDMEKMEYQLANKEELKAKIIQALSLKGEGVYEPYMGWCDVAGCDNEASANGSYWRETGYWCLCSDHAKMARDGKPQLFMKDKSVERERSRGKDGFLPIQQHSTPSPTVEKKLCGDCGNIHAIGGGDCPARKTDTPSPNPLLEEVKRRQAELIAWKGKYQFEEKHQSVLNELTELIQFSEGGK